LSRHGDVISPLVEHHYFHGLTCLGDADGDFFGVHGRVAPVGMDVTYGKSKLTPLIRGGLAARGYVLMQDLTPVSRGNKWCLTPFTL
jgi:hypothetical protein